MPEAPEVQRVTTALTPVVLGGTWVRHRSLHWCFPTVPRITVRHVRRHGKWIVLADRDVACMINLGMSGSFVVGGPVRRHVRWAALIERDGVRTLLQYVDPRCMGRLRVLDATDTACIMRSNARTRGCRELGLGPDAMLTELPSTRWRTLLSVPLPLKRVLMQQHVIAGVGNIYASEACWHARASPHRPADTCTRAQLRALATQVPRMLRTSLRLGGTSIGDANSFRGVDGREGGAGAMLRVYGRAGLPCRRCGTTIVCERQYGRSTYYCPSCQI